MRFTRLQIVLFSVFLLLLMSGVIVLFQQTAPTSNKSIIEIIPKETPLDFNYKSIRKQIQSDDSEDSQFLASTKININSANSDQLQQLPHVGPVTAELIIQYRNLNGAFASVDSLTAVKGIGPKTLEKIKPMAFCGEFSQQSNSSEPKKKPSPEPTQPVVPEAGKININTASAEELQSLPRVGPVMAERIIQYRKDNGPFPTIESIVNVKGIGPKTFLKLKPIIKTEETSQKNASGGASE